MRDQVLPARADREGMKQCECGCGKTWEPTNRKPERRYYKRGCKELAKQRREIAAKYPMYMRCAHSDCARKKFERSKRSRRLFCSEKCRVAAMNRTARALEKMRRKLGRAA